MSNDNPQVKSRPWLERAIAAVSPSTALARAQSRARLEVVNSHLGGLGTRLSSEWGSEPPYNNGSFRQRRHVLLMRDRAQHAYANNPVARSILQTEVTNVVADGFKLQSKGSNPGQKKPSKAVKAWRAECDERWEAWLDQADVRGLMTSAEMQRRPYNSARRLGDGGILLIDAGGFSKLQHIPAHKISTPYGRFGDPTIIDGVEVDASLAPVAYHVLDLDEYGLRTWSRVPANNFVFICPDQDEDLAVRGSSCYATVFELLDQLGGYVDGVVTAARMATVFGLLFKSDAPASQVNKLGMLPSGHGHLQRAITLENGSIKYVGSKDDVVQVDAHQPMQQTPDFIRAIMRLIGQPFDMPLELIAHDMSTVNFASARIGLLQYYRSCRARQKSYKAAWSRIYRWWASRERKRQQVFGAGNPKYGTFVSPFPTEFFAHVLHPRAWEYTDPVREAQGDALQVDMGWKSDQQVAAERGRDIDEVNADQAANYAARRLLNLPTDIRSTLSRDVISVRAQDPASVEGLDAGSGQAGEDPDDPDEATDEPDEEDE